MNQDPRLVNDDIIGSILQKYPQLIVVPATGNANRAWEGLIDSRLVQVIDYGSWCSVTMAFGEVRHAQQTPIGEKGIAAAVLSLSDTSRATALFNHDLPGPKWRMSAIAPKGRTLCAGPDGRRDGYVVTDDILAHLLTFEDSCSQAATHGKDLFAKAWNAAKPGWR